MRSSSSHQGVGRSVALACFVLALIIPATALPVWSYAEEAAQNTAASSHEEPVSQKIADVVGSAEKKEVIYTTLDASGAIQAQYVVNTLTGEEGKVVQDFGTYSDVVNTTDESDLACFSDSVVFTMPQGDFSYQGTVVSPAIPWNITLTYYLDGVEMSAQDLAGKSGSLKLEITTSHNTAVDACYFENYLLQATCTLPSDRAHEVQTDDGSIALSGSDVTVTFMVMPESEGKVSLEAEVENFEMDAISIAAVPFSMAVDFGDTESLVSNFDDLIEGTEQIHEGAQQVSEGVSEIDTATKQAATGAFGLAKGTSQLVQGLERYQQSLQDSSADLAAQADDDTELSAAQSAYEEAFACYTSAVAVAYQEIMDQSQGALDQTEALAMAYEQVNQTDLYRTYSSALKELLEVAGTQAGYKASALALEKAAQGIGTGEDETSLLGGMNSLNQGAEDLALGLDELAGGTGQLALGADSFSEGSATLVQETQGIPDAVNDEIEKIMASYDKSDFEPASFTSSKNTNVTLVQFVMSTDPIKVDEPKQNDDPQPEETFLDRLIALFS